jgi:hypothetical protein
MGQKRFAEKLQRTEAEQRHQRPVEPVTRRDPPDEPGADRLHNGERRLIKHQARKRLPRQILDQIVHHQRRHEYDADQAPGDTYTIFASHAGIESRHAGQQAGNGGDNCHARIVERRDNGLDREETHADRVAESQPACGCAAAVIDRDHHERRRKQRRDKQIDRHDKSGPAHLLLTPWCSYRNHRRPKKTLTSGLGGSGRYYAASNISFEKGASGR